MRRKLIMGETVIQTNLTKVNEIAIEFGQFVVEKLEAGHPQSSDSCLYPLLPLSPPLLALDCSMVSSVNTQNTTGALPLRFRSFIPCATAFEMNSKCLVSP